MSRSARKSAATAALLRHIDSRQSGCLSVGAGSAQIRVYLLNGNLVGAECDDDQRQLARLALLRGAIDLETHQQLDARLEEQDAIFGDLLDVIPSHHLDPLLLNRFHQNLSSFLGDIGRPEFVPQRGIFIDNLQMGHNSITVITQCCELFDRATALDVDSLIVSGPQPPVEPEHKRLMPFLSRSPRTVSSVLHDLPFEPLLARRLLIDMIQAGCVSPWVEEAARPAADFDDEEDEEVDDAPTVWVDDDILLDEPTDVIDDADDVAVDDLDVDEEPVDEEPVDEEPVDGEGVDEGDGEVEADDVDDFDLPEAESPFETVEPPLEEDEPTVHDGDADTVPVAAASEPEVDPELMAELENVETPAPAPKTEMSGISSLDAWLNSATHVDDDELDFFSDHDYERGSGDEGAFSTESHNLDKVEVGGMSSPHEVIEAAEVPAARFSAPVLSEDDALGKIEVANEVLGLVVEAFDHAEGSGRGRAVVQLLVDGSPSRYAALLHDVQVDERGSLPDDEILSNLYVRPPTEHRQLINQTLVDIIERALSSAADELPDEAFDHVLERVAGYRQRLGL